MNNKNRVFINEDYLNFIRRLPCSAKGITGVHAHHAATKGMGSVRNDYYAIPLSWEPHTGKGHITEARLTDYLKEGIEERVIFYLALFIEWKAGRYDLDADESCNFYELRKKLKQY